ncbi:MAG: cation diffusion facilitator family transporter [Ethanoligenens sp.]|uniref:cation diffusion facilitator family transporter n=1 Tax=Ethanoligenens sp. TaxID=2099655 RepID=UPI0039E879B0
MNFLSDHSPKPNPLIEHVSTADRTRFGMIGGGVGIGVNALIFVAEIIIGLLTHSVAITADAFHNLTDVASSLITVISFKVASRPADREHPFGHGRMEYIAELLIAMIIILIGFEFVQSSIEKVLHPAAVHFSIIPFVLVLLFIPLKLLLSLFYRYLSKRIRSSALQATATDALSDVFVLAVASVSLLCARFTTLPVDGWLGLLVSVFILYSGFSIGKKAVNPLLGEAPNPVVVREIVEGVRAYPYITGVHDLVIHNYGPGKFMATIHAEVPADVPVMELHESIDRAEHELSQKHGIILVIHMDPLNKNDETVIRVQNELLEAIKPLSVIRSIHDFRIVGKDKHLNLVFDAVVDNSVPATTGATNQLVQEINSLLKQKHPNYRAVVQIDRNYTPL